MLKEKRLREGGVGPAILSPVGQKQRRHHEGGVGPGMLSPAGLINIKIYVPSTTVNRPIQRERIGDPGYIDGFNLYLGLRAKGWRKYYWLDLAAMSRALLKPGQRLVHCHYFTARLRTGGQSQDTKRQNTGWMPWRRARTSPATLVTTCPSRSAETRAAPPGPVTRKK